MADLAYPFDDAPVYQAEWETMATLWAPDGLDARTPLVTLGSGLAFSVPSGLGGNVRGFRYRNTSAQTKTAAANTNSNSRIDRLVLRLDRSAKTVVPAIKQGTPAASPIAPALTQTAGGVWEIPMYRATCPGSGSAQNYVPGSLLPEWTPVSSERGKHIWTGSVSANESSPTVNFAAGQFLSDGIASINGAGNLALNLAGVWSIDATVDTDTGIAGMSTLSVQWPGGEFRDSFRADSRYRGSGHAGAGRLRQQVSFHGLVRPLAAAAPISISCGWFPASGSASVTYPVRLYADYLGA